MKYVSLAEPGGYGLAALAYVHGLHSAGVPLVWTPLFRGAGGYLPASSARDALRKLEEVNLPPEAADLRDAVLATGAADVCVLHTVPELWHLYRQPHGTHVGYTVWETTAVPPHWPDLLNSVDRLLTPSRLSAEVIRSAGVTPPIDVVPHLHRPPTATASGPRFRERHGIRAADTVFYTIGAWTARKAVWRTIHAYCSAFTAGDSTTLVVKTGPVGPAHEGDSRAHPVQRLVHELVNGYPDPPEVCLIVRDLRQDEMDDLHAAGDCYLSLAHAEGWGLGAFDAACAGRPVVMTGWGGQLDYLGGGDALLLDYELVPVRDRLGADSYRPDQRWALARLEEAVDRLQWVHRHRSEAAAMGARLAARLTQEFAGARIIPRLARLLGA